MIDAVSRFSGISGAAGALNMSPSTVSRNLSSAEVSLGVALFQKGWGGFEPTTEGEIAALHCRTAVRLIGKVESRLSEQTIETPRLVPFLEWKHLAAVEMVVRVGSATEAARQLGISQPAISHALREVKHHARQPLFRRLRSGLETLEAARYLSRLFAQLRAEISEIPELIKGLSGTMTGRVAVGVLPFSEEDIVSEVFGALSREHPHLRLLAMHAPHNLLAEALLRGEIDCMIGLLRQPSPHVEFDEIPMVKEHYTLVARSDHPCHQSVGDLSDLTENRWVVAPDGTPVRSYFEGLFALSNKTPPTQTCEMLSFNSAEQVLLNSDLIALLTYSEQKRATLRTGLKALEIELPDTGGMVGMTLSRSTVIKPPLQQFQKKLAAAFASRASS